MADPQVPPHHFVLFGVPVRIELFFFIIPLLAFQSRDVAGAAVWTVVIFTGVLAHELGHALAMRSSGLTPHVTLHGFGGVTRPIAGGQITPKQSFFITLAGPATGLLLGLIIFGVGRALHLQNPIARQFVDDAFWVNVVWSFVNLIPAVPWDGGLMLDSGLHWATGKRHPRVVGVSAMLGGGLMIAVAVKLRMIFLGYFGLLSVMEGLKRFNGTRPANDASGLWSKIHAGDEVEQDLEFEIRTAADPAKRAQFAEMLAWSKLKKNDSGGARRAIARMGGYQPTVSLLARIAAAEGENEKVADLLSAEGAATANDLPLLLSALIVTERFDEVVKLSTRHPAIADQAEVRLFKAGAYQACITVSTELRKRTHDGRYAYNEACCLVKLGRLDEAVLALQLAKDLGSDALKNLQTDEDLEPIRDRPEVRALLDVNR